ncbi:hypothetical protein [Microtetraspora glauca]|uniref:Uncharacterized protein n=1 Tax=Microtetraspora glauca TaxID=1996 RepID=A0ABV3GA39_MICGL
MKDTTADELRTAVARLRCEHSFPVQPPHGTAWAPGPCEHCGIAWDIGLPLTDVPERLRGTLATLLDVIADEYEMPPCDHPDGVCTPCERRDDFVAAVAAARAINGGGSD